MSQKVKVVYGDPATPFAMEVVKGSYDDPYKGLYSDTGEYPAKAEFFGPFADSVMCYAGIMEVEQLLSDFGVFVNGIRGTRCNPDSYMTIVQDSALRICLHDLKTRYAPTKEDWMPLICYWLTNPNVQPPLREIAMTISRQQGIVKEEWTTYGLPWQR